MDELSITATMENMGIYEFETDTGDIAVLRGRIWVDNKNRFDPGDIIRTSGVIYVQGQYVYTRNSLYKVEW